MIAVKIRFITGRYHATPWGRHVNEGVPEWPPSPWRLFRAMVASWKIFCDELPESEVAALLDELSADPPLFRLPPATAGHSRSYSPLYKQDEKALVFDTFVSIPKTAETLIIWPDVELPGEKVDVFKKLLAGIGYLGRAESWCDLKVNFDGHEPNCFPLHSSAVGMLDNYEEVRVLCPDANGPGDLLDNLQVETGSLRSKQKKLVPPGSSWVTYARRSDVFEISHVRRAEYSPGMAEPPVAAIYALDRFVLPPLQETLAVGEQARSAVMGCFGRLFDGGVSPVLSGRDDKGPLTGHRHAFYLPIDADRDGRADHLVVYAPAGFGSRERKALGSLREIPWGDRADLRDQDESRRLKVVLLGFYRKPELARAVVPTGPSAVWRSVTPYTLTRHPKIYRDGRPKINKLNEQVDGPEDQFRREWASLKAEDPDLPGILKITRLSGHEMEGGKTLRWLSFRTRKKRGRGANAGFICGLQVEFDGPHTGPLAVGYGCHCGLGQFMPAY